MSSDSGADQLQGVCKDACDLLDALTHASNPTVSEGRLEIIQRRKPIDKSLLEGCDGLVFLWTIKAGMLLAVSHSTGFMIRRLGSGRWTAPCFVKATAGSAGLVIGMEKVSTILVAKSVVLADELLAGRHPILGADVSVQTLSAMDSAPDSYNLQNVPYGDLVSTSIAKGAFLDLSLSGGSMTVDEGRNAECHGSGVSTHAILSGEAAAPTQLAPLYERIDAILKK